MAMITTEKELTIDSKEKTDSNDDSKQPMLVLDVLISILDRLSFADFRRARCISSEWYSASKSCIRGTNPWLIFFPKEHHEIKNDSCKLFDPRDKNSYTIRDVGFDFARTSCVASYGSWFLMLDGRILHLLNLFTRERIPLPSLESIDESEMIVMRMNNSVFYATLDYKDKARRKLSYVMTDIIIRKAFLWVDEKSRDYLVVWSNDYFLAYQKRGDNNNNNESWKVFQPLKSKGCVDMVLKESKLYVLRTNGVVTVFDFSGGDSPMEFASFKSPDCYHPYSYNNLAVTLSGEVLFISNMGRSDCNVYKMDTTSSEWRIIESIGDETLLLDQGITVAAKGGLVKNCIYFSKHQFYYYENRRNDDNKGICVYNIKTKKVFKVFKHLTASDARWFFPTFGEK